MKIFEQAKLGSLDVYNRIVMPPMCTYSSDKEGLLNQFHFQHYGARSLGGVGIIIQEATAVMPSGRISSKDLGLWNEIQQEISKNLVDYIRIINPQTKIMVQLAHAGRKSRVTKEDGSLKLWSPSAIAFDEKSELPKEMTLEDIEATKKSFVNSTKRAVEAGYDGVQIHCAHGYLLNSFLSSVSNKRNDSYGGSLENRVKIVREILEEIRGFFPADKVLSIRVSAVDYSEYDKSKQEIIDIVKILSPLLDFVDISSGGITNIVPKVYPLYQVDLAGDIKKAVSIPVIAVGLITTKEEAEYIISSNKADFVALGRDLLRNPHWVLLNHPNVNSLEHLPQSYKLSFAK